MRRRMDASTRRRVDLGRIEASTIRHTPNVTILSAFAGRSTTTLGRSIDRIEINIESIESKKRKMPLLKELSRSSWDLLESESDSKESWDVRLNSFKSGIFHFCHF